MRFTFSQLIADSQDICIDDSSTTYTGLSDTKSFIKREINSTNADIFNLLRKYKLQPPPYTESTVANQTYYNFRPGLSKLTSATIQISANYIPPLKIVTSEEEWNSYQQIPINSAFPTHIYPRRDTYGIYPTPQAVYTMTLSGIWIPLNMTADDNKLGTIQITTNSASVVGTSTAFTSSMVGSWLGVTDGTSITGNMYRISSVTDATHLTLDRNIIDSSGSGLSYIIGQSPEIPEELHQFIPYRVGATYYAVRRRNPEIAQQYLNYFWTGDFSNSKREGEIIGGVLNVLRDLMEKGRDNSSLVETGGGSGTADVIRDASWTSIITAS